MRWRKVANFIHRGRLIRESRFEAHEERERERMQSRYFDKAHTFHFPRMITAEQGHTNRTSIPKYFVGCRTKSSNWSVCAGGRLFLCMRDECAGQNDEFKLASCAHQPLKRPARWDSTAKGLIEMGAHSATARQRRRALWHLTFEWSENSANQGQLF